MKYIAYTIAKAPMTLRISGKTSNMLEACLLGFKER